MRGLSQTENETLAMDPPLGTGTGLPMGMKSSSSIDWGAEHGPITRTRWPHSRNCPASLLIWTDTPPGTA